MKKKKKKRERERERERERYKYITLSDSGCLGEHRKLRARPRITHSTFVQTKVNDFLLVKHLGLHSDSDLHFLEAFIYACTAMKIEVLTV